jgi:hypothetical protein
MTTKTETPASASIQVLLSRVMNDVNAVKKTDRNTAQNFSFRGIDAVVNAVAPALREHGVIVMPEVLEHTYSTVEVGRNRTQMEHVIVRVKYTFTGTEGDSLSCTVLGEAMDAGDKATPKAMSVAFRIALLQALALPTDEPDPDSYSYERAEAKPHATYEQVEAWGVQMQNAQTLAELDGLAQIVRGYDIPKETTESLRTTYTTRREELSNVEAQSID